MHFIHKILCFEGCLHKIALFFKKLVFLEFRSIESISRPIEIAIKLFSLYFRLAQSVFIYKVGIECSVGFTV